MESIEAKILETLGITEGGTLEAIEISKSINLSYNSTRKYLKGMVEKSLLERERKARTGDNLPGARQPWVYYYSINPMTLQVVRDEKRI